MCRSGERMAAWTPVAPTSGSTGGTDEDLWYPSCTAPMDSLGDARASKHRPSSAQKDASRSGVGWAREVEAARYSSDPGPLVHCCGPVGPYRTRQSLAVWGAYGQHVITLGDGWSCR